MRRVLMQKSAGVAKLCTEAVADCALQLQLEFIRAKMATDQDIDLLIDAVAENGAPFRRAKLLQGPICPRTRTAGHVRRKRKFARGFFF